MIINRETIYLCKVFLYGFITVCMILNLFFPIFFIIGNGRRFSFSNIKVWREMKKMERKLITMTPIHWLFLSLFLVELKNKKCTQNEWNIQCNIYAIIKSSKIGCMPHTHRQAADNINPYRARFFLYFLS